MVNVRLFVGVRGFGCALYSSAGPSSTYPFRTANHFSVISCGNCRPSWRTYLHLSLSPSGTPLLSYSSGNKVSLMCRKHGLQCSRSFEGRVKMVPSNCVAPAYTRLWAPCMEPLDFRSNGQRALPALLVITSRCGTCRVPSIVFSV